MILIRVDKDDVVRVHNAKAHVGNGVLDNFSIVVAREEHPCLGVLTFLAFMVGSLVRMGSLILPITEFNRCHRHLVMIFDHLD